MEMFTLYRKTKIEKRIKNKILATKKVSFNIRKVSFNIRKTSFNINQLCETVFMIK